MQIDQVSLTSVANSRILFNELCQAMEPAAALSFRIPTGSTSRILPFYGVRVLRRPSGGLTNQFATEANQSFLAVASATRFWVFTAGAFSFSQQTTLDETDGFLLSRVVAGSASITSDDDYRIPRHFDFNIFTRSTAITSTGVTSASEGTTNRLTRISAASGAPSFNLRNSTNLNSRIGYAFSVSQGTAARVTLIADSGATILNEQRRLRGIGAEVRSTLIATNTFSALGSFENILPLARTSATSTTLELSDASSVLSINSANAETVTIPNDTAVNFEVGSFVHVRRMGAGALSIVAGSGVTVEASDSLNLRKQFSECVLTKTGANAWTARGDFVLT